MAINSDFAKLVTDGLSLTTVIATIAGYLPAIAAIVSIVWTLIRIIETDTIQAALARHRARRALRISSAVRIKREVLNKGPE
jgi:hypothetical protein